MKKAFNFVYVLNIAVQSFFSLGVPVCLSILVSWLFVSKCRAPAWIYAPIVIFGVAVGFFSMVKFVISGMSAVERLEEEQNIKYGTGNSNNEKK